MISLPTPPFASQNVKIANLCVNIVLNDNISLKLICIHNLTVLVGSGHSELTEMSEHHHSHLLRAGT